MNPITKITPLGDSACLVYCDDEAAAATTATAIRVAEPAWIVDVVLAYATVAVYYDLHSINFEAAANWLTRIELNQSLQSSGRLLVIPCCYEMGMDCQRVADFKCISVEQVARWHSQTVYTVYAIGFCPGFPYMGYLPEPIDNVPRLDSPRLQVEAGSVAITGRQTGIYPLPRPGGWNIIGRTPLTLVDLDYGYFALSVGDRVRFEAIGRARFDELYGQRLQPIPIAEASPD